MNKALSLEKNKNMKIILTGYMFSIAITLILLFIYATILSKTNVKETTITPVVMGITASSILIGSILSCIKIKKNGILNGICIGTIYFITMYLLSSCVGNSYVFSLKAFEMLLLEITFGGIGGIMGVNIGK